MSSLVPKSLVVTFFSTFSTFLFDTEGKFLEFDIAILSFSYDFVLSKIDGRIVSASNEIYPLE